MFLNTRSAREFVALLAALAHAVVARRVPVLVALVDVTRLAAEDAVAAEEARPEAVAVALARRARALGERTLAGLGGVRDVSDSQG